VIATLQCLYLHSALTGS